MSTLIERADRLQRRTAPDLDRSELVDKTRFGAQEGLPQNRPMQDREQGETFAAMRPLNTPLYEPAILTILNSRGLIKDVRYDNHYRSALDKPLGMSR